MNYKYAKRLHKGDEVTIKKTGVIKMVLEVEIQEKTVLVRTDDWCLYAHNEIR